MMPGSAAAPVVGAARTGSRGEQALAVGALAFLLGVTALWWRLALWSDPAAPAWLQTARAVCFGAHDDGLPGAGGWILLIGEPVGMAAALLAVLGKPLRAGLRAVGRHAAGRTLLAVAALLVLAGASAAGVRVRQASRDDDAPAAAGDRVLRLDRPAPALALKDQRGETFQLDRLRGRPVVVAFAFAHCTTVCPLLVRDVMRARDAAPPDRRPHVVIVTVDPWRDTPARLPAIAGSWKLESEDRLLSGTPADVQAVLREWDVPFRRDLTNGEVTHGPVAYVLDREGRIRFATAGRRGELELALART